MRLHGKTVMVTGGATGLGLAFAQRLHADGAHVVIADLRGASQAAQSLDDSGRTAQGLVMDVADEASVREAVTAVGTTFGGVDILVNNAALFSTLVNKPFEEYSGDEWMQVMRVNTLGPFNCAKAVAPHMKAQRWGRIINVASTSALKGLANMAHYVTSKGAVITFTRVLARELGAWNITANALDPARCAPVRLGGSGQLPGQRRLGLHDGPDAVCRRWRHLRLMAGTSAACITKRPSAFPS